MAFRHKFVSAVADGGNAALVQPTNWNADHSLTGFPGIICGRLTLTSQYPVNPADVTAATTIYFAPYLGNQISLYNGSTSQWDIINYVQASLSLSGFTASLPYDIFGYNSSGTLVLEAAVWTNSTTRATALADEGGALVKSADHTRVLLGTIRTTSTTGQCEDSVTKRFVSNVYNRRPRPLRRVDSGTWTYSTAAFRQANANSANQIEVVSSIGENLLSLAVVSSASNSTSGFTLAAGIGQNSTTTAMSSLNYPVVTSIASSSVVMVGQADAYPAVGYSYFAWLEYGSGSGTTTWNGLNVHGLIGSIDA